MSDRQPLADDAHLSLGVEAFHALGAVTRALVRQLGPSFAEAVGGELRTAIKELEKLQLHEEVYAVEHSDVWDWITDPPPDGDVPR